MSLESAILFWQNVQADQSLQQELKPVRELPQEARPAAVAKIANGAGYTVTADELMQMESVIKFWADVQEKPGLQSKLESARQSESEEEALNAVMAAAKAAGYGFAREALSVVTSALVGPGSGPQSLNEGDLSQVVGGARGSGDDSNQTADYGGLFPRIPKHDPGAHATYI